jgi:hypothetical protein
MQYKKIIISLLFISQINMGMKKNILDIYRPKTVQIKETKKPIDELLITIKCILEEYKPEEIQTFIAIDRDITHIRKQQMSLLLKKGMEFIHTIQQAINTNKKTTVENKNDNITTKTKKKRRKKKPQTNNSLKKKTKYTLPDLPVLPKDIKPIPQVKSEKSKLQYTLLIKRTLIRNENARNEADLKKILNDICYDHNTPCMFTIFNEKVGWHYDRKTNDLSIIFNDEPFPCDYDHSSQDSSSD